jgi:hypothetical protein
MKTGEALKTDIGITLEFVEQKSNKQEKDNVYSLLLLLCWNLPFCPEMNVDTFRDKGGNFFSQQ